MSASGGGPPVGGPSSLVREFWNDYQDNAQGDPVSGLKLDTFRQLATAFNVWGINPVGGVTESSGFSGCIPEGAANSCSSCPSSVFDHGCTPQKARIEHSISIVAS